MRLPQQKNMGVQALGQRDISLPQKLANKKAGQAVALGKANVNMVQAKGMVVTEAIESVNNIAGEAGKMLGQIAADDAAHYSAQASQRMMEFNASMSKPTVTADEARRMGADVTSLKTYGDAIPIHKVQAQATADFLHRVKVNAREEMDDRAYDIWEQEFDQKADVLRVKTQSRIVGQEISFRKNRTVEDANILLNQGKTGEAVAMLNNSANFSEVEKVALIGKFRQRGAHNDVTRAASSKDPIQMQKVIDSLEAGDFSILSPQAVQKSISMLKESQYRAGAEARARQERHRAGQVYNLEAGIKGIEGTVDPLTTSHKDIDEAFNKGVIKTHKERLRLHNQLTAEQGLKTVKAKRSVDLDAILSGDANADPYDKGTISAVNERYESNPTPEEGIYLARKTKVLPDAFRSQMVGDMVNGTPKDQKAAADNFASIQYTGALSLRQVPNEVRLRQEMLASLPFNSDIEVGVEKIDKALNMPAGELEQREAAFNIQTKDKPLPDWVKGYMDDDESKQFDTEWGPWSEVTWDDIPPEVQGDYLAQVKINYLASRDMGSATKAAYNTTIRDTTSAENINGQWKAMKFPPSLEYGLDVEEVAGDWESYKNFKGMGEDSIYVSDFLTGKQPIGSKDYAVYEATSDDGLLDTHTRWRPELAIVRQKEEANFRKKQAQVTPEKVEEIQAKGDASVESRKYRKEQREKADIYDLAGKTKAAGEMIEGAVDFLGDAVGAAGDFLKHKEPGDKGHSQTKKPAKF